MVARPCVFVVDDDPKMLRIVAEVLSGEAYDVAVYSKGTDFLAAYQPEQRGCLLLDIQMPGLNGAELQRELTHRQIDLPIIFLTATADVPTTVELMKRGAADLLQKPFDVPTLLKAVERAIESDQAAYILRQQQAEIHQRVERLTPRETEVMELVVTGHANKQIAYELKLSEKTVEIHRSRVMKKMEAQSVAELVRQCLMRATARRGQA